MSNIKKSVNRSDVERIINEEEELTGDMPDSIWSMFQTRKGAADVMRANVRAIKFNLLKKLDEI